MEQITWEKEAEAHFNKILEQIPDMVRGIAETRVSKKAQALAREAGGSIIDEKVMVDAFFAETPSGFVPAMKQGMKDIGIDVTKYGHAA